jgi:hypothetical protein
VESSKHLAFLSLHKHYIRHKGIIFHTTALRERPPVPQQAFKSSTLQGITQCNLNRLKIACHSTCATSQWRSKWSTDSLSGIHKQHRFITTICFFLRLSKVRIFPRAIVHAKKAILEGAFIRQILFHGKGLDSNFCLHEEAHYNLSSPSLRNFWEYSNE